MNDPPERACRCGNIHSTKATSITVTMKKCCAGAMPGATDAASNEAACRKMATTGGPGTIAQASTNHCQCFRTRFPLARIYQRRRNRTNWRYMSRLALDSPRYPEILPVLQWRNQPSAPITHRPDQPFAIAGPCLRLHRIVRLLTVWHEACAIGLFSLGTALSAIVELRLKEPVRSEE